MAHILEQTPSSSTGAANLFAAAAAMEDSNGDQADYSSINRLVDHPFSSYYKLILDLFSELQP